MRRADDRVLILQKPGEEIWRLAATGWLLVGVTVPPEPDAPEVDSRCGRCESALARAALLRPLALKGVHCGHCGRVSRAKWLDEWEGGI
jgi:hypothetical protein